MAVHDSKKMLPKMGAIPAVVASTLTFECRSLGCNEAMLHPSDLQQATRQQQARATREKSALAIVATSVPRECPVQLLLKLYVNPSKLGQR